MRSALRASILFCVFALSGGCAICTDESSNRLQLGEMTIGEEFTVKTDLLCRKSDIKQPWWARTHCGPELSLIEPGSDAMVSDPVDPDESRNYPTIAEWRTAGPTAECPQMLEAGTKLRFTKRKCENIIFDSTYFFVVHALNGPHRDEYFDMDSVMEGDVTYRRLSLKLFERSSI